MNLVKVKCAFCGKEFFREKGRFNEAEKFGWNQYCSQECQNKAKLTRVEKVCGNPNCNKKVTRQLKEFRKSKSGLIFCSRSCAAIFNNRRYPKNTGGRKSKLPKLELQACMKCGTLFRKSKGNFKYCSTQCRREAKRKYTPQQIIDIIKHAVQELKRVPARREMKEIANRCPDIFGSWNNAVIAAGFQPNRSHSQRMYKRTETRALDGHLCDSVSEAIIDNWLARNGIPHKKDVPYPNTNHKADWGIRSGEKYIFIEYFGLAGDSSRYDRGVKKKRALCHKHKITLVEIYPEDLYPKRYLEDKLKDKFGKLISIFNVGDSGLEPLYSRPRDERLTN